MQGITPNKIAKYLIYVFLAYILWFKYIFGEKAIILYGSTILAAACMFYDLLVSHQNQLEVFPTGVLVNVFMCVYSIVVGVFAAKNMSLLMSTVKTYSAFSIVCLVVCYVSNKEDGFDWLLKAFIVIDILCAITVLTRGYYWPNYGYVLSPRNNPNSFGRTMALGLFCLMYRTQKNRKRLVLSVGVAILFIYAIVGCGSRKSLFAAIIVCSLWLFHQSRIIWRNGSGLTRIALLFFIAVLVVSVAYYYNNVYLQSDISTRMESLGDQAEGSSRNRMLYYTFAIDYFLEKPLFGIGLQQFVVWNPLRQFSHSTYAEAIADWGLVGCLIYFIPAILAAINLIKAFFLKVNSETTRSIIALWIIEVFLGLGQIWFYEVEHMIAWTIIYIYAFNLEKTRAEKEINIERKCKYVKA